MTTNHRTSRLAASLILFTSFALAGDQTKPGPGNSSAASLASQSPIVQSALGFLVDQAADLKGNKLKKETLDAITNPDTCVKHRAGLKASDRQAILNTLLTQGLVDPADDGTFPGGLITGVFPPVLNDNSSCPRLPQPFYSAPGSVYYGHHSYPGGLPVHESTMTLPTHTLPTSTGPYTGTLESWDFPPSMACCGRPATRSRTMTLRSILTRT